VLVVLLVRVRRLTGGAGAGKGLVPLTLSSQAGPLRSSPRLCTLALALCLVGAFGRKLFE